MIRVPRQKNGEAEVTQTEHSLVEHAKHGYVTPQLGRREVVVKKSTFLRDLQFIKKTTLNLPDLIKHASGCVEISTSIRFD